MQWRLSKSTSCLQEHLIDTLFGEGRSFMKKTLTYVAVRIISG